MTEYFNHNENLIADATGTNGIVNREYLEQYSDIEWVTGVSPDVLRDWANLIEFVYGHARHDALDLGLVEAPHIDIPAVVLGDAEGDRWVMFTPRRDCYAGKGSTQDTTLGEFDK